MGLLLAVAGWATYVFAPKVGPNPLFGVRTGYNMVNREVWNRSNRVGGLLIAAVGVVVALAGVVAGLWQPVSADVQVLVISGVMMALLIGGTVWLFLYTRRLARGVPVKAARPIRVSPALLLPAAVVAAATVAFVLATASQLPSQKVATHFGMDGSPNDWMTAAGYTWFVVVMDMVLLAVPAGILLGLRRIPMPGADEWPITGEAVLEAVAMIFAWAQLLIGFIALDTYWFNVRGSHVMPLGLTVAVVMATAALLLPAVILYVVVQGRKHTVSKAQNGKEQPY